MNVGEYRITDSKGNAHTFTIRWHERLGMRFFFLDGKKIDIDDRLGWSNYEGRRVGDKVLRSKMDVIALGEVVPEGGDTEEG